MDILKGKTAAKDKVYDSRLYSMNDSTLPGIIIFSSQEEIVTSTISPPRCQNRTARITVECYAKATTSVNIIVDNMTAEVESLVLNNPELRGTFGEMFGGGGSLGGISSIFGGVFANGGTVKPGKAHVVGDGGEPELFIPNSVGSIVPFSKLEASGASNNNIVVNMNIQTPDISSFNQSRSQIAADMARQIARSSRNL
ncbi:hypothetical protein [Candidatus Tisiphia endosymbiont of Ptychoptera albimana]|uniref:hypothetical protein n=1 Tax=Candidatus Tisiphia endosymbiont of Ptychoptera albimana TaxID=3066260 RepID=UPI00312CB4A5